MNAYSFPNYVLLKWITENQQKIIFLQSDIRGSKPFHLCVFLLFLFFGLTFKSCPLPFAIRRPITTVHRVVFEWANNGDSLVRCRWHEHHGRELGQVGNNDGTFYSFKLGFGKIFGFCLVSSISRLFFPYLSSMEFFLLRQFSI